jgi:hypothetical protein
MTVLTSAVHQKAIYIFDLAKETILITILNNTANRIFR